VQNSHFFPSILVIFWQKARNHVDELLVKVTLGLAH